MLRFVERLFRVSCTFATLLSLLCCVSCDQRNNDNNTIIFATCADYPPFEYYEDGKLVGFDVELAKLLAAKLGKTAVFKDMAYSAILMSLQNGTVDAAIAAMSCSPERAQKFDCTGEYYKSGRSLLFKKWQKVARLEDIKSGEKIACQLGCNDHKAHIAAKAPTAEIVLIDNINAAVEALNAGHVSYVYLDTYPAKTFCKKNSDLGSCEVAQDEYGYAICLKKCSALTVPLSQELSKAVDSGEVAELQQRLLS
ncbi:MAG: ABC transporter substrate-binding protein [Holosporales bacterium]|jgi:polar amino acid transport system substrate-binding protein|nr:ABC transporter substrate-binding protein [Holosporales bacterium]